MAKSEESSLAELDNICGEATEHPSARLCVASRRSRVILASQARLSLWAHVMLSASILDLLRSCSETIRAHCLSAGSVESKLLPCPLEMGENWSSACLSLVFCKCQQV